MLSQQLDAYISEIDSDTIPLETAIQKYADAIKVAKKASEKLTGLAEQITVLNETSQTLIEQEIHP